MINSLRTVQCLVSSIGRGFQTCNFRGFFLRVENAPEQSKNGLKVILMDPFGTISTDYQSSKKKLKNCRSENHA